MSIHTVEVTLWLEQPRYDALQRNLRESGTDLETVMQARLEEFYRQTVPDLEREKINLSMEAERLAEEREREANMKLSAFRLMEEGQDSYFIAEKPVEFLEMAHLLRRYLRGNMSFVPDRFVFCFDAYKWLTESQFQDLVQERMKDPQRIVSVFNVDFDKREVSLVDATQGWQSYRMRDVSNAAYEAFRKQGIDREKRLTKFLDRLQGKEIAPQQEQKTGGHLAVFHVTEDGRSSRFMVKGKIELLQVAYRLRNYIHRTKDDPPARFADVYSNREVISREQYDTFVMERLDNTGRVAGAYNIDLDKGTFDAVSIMDGWQSFHMRDVTTAAYFAMKDPYGSWERQWEVFLDHLEGKQLSDYEPPYLSGIRTLRAEDISFEGDIEQNDDWLKFFMEVTFDPGEVFGTEDYTTSGDIYVRVHANYDLYAQQVCDTLDVVLETEEFGGGDFKYRLCEEEQAVMLSEMDSYCQQRYGLSLEDWRIDYLKEQHQTPQEMQM